MSQVLQGEGLSVLINQCILSYERDKRPARSVKNLKNLLGRFATWLSGRELTVKECRGYVKHMQDKGLAWTSVSSDTRRLKSFLKWLYMEANDGDGLIPADWAKDFHSPRRYGEKEKPQEQLLAPEKMLEYVLKVTEPGPNDHKLHREIKLEHREFLLFYMKTGLRPGEAMSILPENVNLDSDYPNALVWRGKNGKWQPIGLPLDYLEPIRRRVSEGRWFNVTQSRLEIYMRRISKLAGRTVKLYSIRKSMDTFALDEDSPIMKLSYHQGHTVAIMEQNYTKFSAKQSSEVNNAYNPWIDRSKLPIKFTLPRIEKLAKEVERHPAFKVSRQDGKITISWPEK